MLHIEIQNRLRRVVAKLLPDADHGSVQVLPCPDPRHGDYQTNALMGLAKARRMNPRQLASDVVEQLDLSDCCESATVAGGGFVNFRLSRSAVARNLGDAFRGEHLFHEVAEQPKTFVVDFSSPNVAKPMHVGHIRSTILGDCLARVLRLMGHRVVTDNHIGDWGTQFGKLLVGWRRYLDRDRLAAQPLAEMERLYRKVNVACEEDESVLIESRQELVKLQGGDPENVKIWQEMIEHSREEFDRVYARLGVRFDHTLGESFYNPELKSVVQQLVDRQIAEPSEGALVVFFPEDPSLKGNPAIVQKSDGAANYTTTDLATLDHRCHTWSPDAIIYVTDGRQQLHFRQVFSIFKRWQPEKSARLVHVWFGSILGEDGKPFKTRSGETVKLEDLLDEAEERAFKVVTEKNPDLDEEVCREIARVVGLGAVKYADLSPNRQSDYVFSWERMLALTGNTAPYLQYAYTRIRSIFKKNASADSEATAGSSQPTFPLASEEEFALAKHLLNFGMVLDRVSQEYRPNYLCNYLYELAGHFARFYEQCPVLQAEGEERAARVALCDLTARVLEKGLELLGIETTERM